MLNLNKNKKIHFIGIGGVSMSALSRLLFSRGYSISGSDISYGKWFEQLINLGIEVYIGSDITKVGMSDLVVYNHAIPLSDIELSYAINNNIQVINRAELLGIIAKEYREVIAISGAHGKTTTTSMIASVLNNTLLEFTAHIGGVPIDVGDNLIYRGDDIFLTEACEYKRSFLELSPTISVILNIEYDHPDCFEDASAVTSVFRQFINVNKLDSNIILSEQAIEVLGVLEDDIHKTISFGCSESCNWYITNIVNNMGQYYYDLYRYGIFWGRINLKVYGRHNIYNSVSSIIVCDLLGVNSDSIINSINNFNGVGRRLQPCGQVSGANVYHDYAHHPSELQEVINTAKEMSDKRLCVCFQPHTKGRTEQFFEQFIQVLEQVDELILLKTYEAREESVGKSSWDLFLAVSDNLPKKYFDDFMQASSYISRSMGEEDILFVVGAGDIELMTQMFE